MDLSKGSYVRCKDTGKRGVVADIPGGSSFMYVRWLNYWDSETKTAHHYLEYVYGLNVEPFALTESDPGLEEIRRKVLR